MAFSTRFLPRELRTERKQQERSPSVAELDRREFANERVSRATRLITRLASMRAVPSRTSLLEGRAKRSVAPLRH